MKPIPIPIKGGVDTQTSPALVKDGLSLSSWNYEPNVGGGARRIYGYERYSGRSAPSDAVYYVFEVTTSGEFTVGDTITGATSGETAVIISVTDPSEIIVTKVSGDFTASETLNVSGSPEGTFIESTENGGSTSALHAQYKNLAADVVIYLSQPAPVLFVVYGISTASGMLFGIMSAAQLAICLKPQVRDGQLLPLDGRFNSIMPWEKYPKGTR